jgi:hypothetical protein
MNNEKTQAEPNSNLVEAKRSKKMADLDPKTIIKKTYTFIAHSFQGIIKKAIAATEEIAKQLIAITTFFMSLSLIILLTYFIDYLDYQDTFWAKFVNYSFWNNYHIFAFAFWSMNIALALFCSLYLKFKFKYSDREIRNIQNKVSLLFWPVIIYIAYSVTIGGDILRFIFNIF